MSSIGGNMSNYYIGLDIGTNSVGWAVTDENYNIDRFNKKNMWGVRLFDEAKTSEDRRNHRQARRRRQRKVERLNLLMELFDKEVSNIDESFFLRKKESDLYYEDKSQDSKYALFNDKDFNDKDYHEKYPTIFHLIMDLIENDEKKDIRLVYLACHYLIKHRGHFIFEGQKLDSNSPLDQMLDRLKNHLDKSYDTYLEFNNDNLIKILSDDTCGKIEKSKKVKEYFGKSPLEKASSDAISGKNFKLSNMFSDDTLKNSGYNSLSLAKSDFDENIEAYENLLDDRFELIEILKEIYDASILESMLASASISPDGSKYISSSKVNTYNKHKKDLKILKKVIKKYCYSEYDNIFRNEDVKNNYVAYSRSSISNNERVKANDYTNSENFSKYIKNILTSIKENDEDLNYILSEIDNNSFMPKQRTSENSVIPYQLRENELRKILDNQAKYHKFLCDTDEKGISVKDKIISLLTFRLPYYVGPVNPAYNEEKDFTTSWVKRLAKGKVKPWNFEEMIDVEASRQAFIENKLSKCSFLLDETVLAKESLLYQEYMVLNELNNIKVNGESIGNKLKEKIFEDLFKNYKKVSQKRLISYIKEKENILEDIVITGIDGDFKQGLKSYITFKEIIGEKIDDDYYKRKVEEIIRDISLYGDDKKFIKNKIKANYSKDFNEDELIKIVKLKFKDWGRLSKKLLVGITATDKESGESDNIIGFMRNYNYNIMQLMSNAFTFKKEIENLNSHYYKDEKISHKMLDDLYISPPVKRMLWQSIQIVDEIKKIKKKDPEKIFIEMARGKEDVGRRKLSRKSKLEDLYKSSKKQFINIFGTEEYDKLNRQLQSKSNNDLRWDNLYLYYTQFGRCMYSLEPIDIEEISNKNLYDQDHIFPKSKIYDDSIENRVLVKKQLNVAKSNEYPIPEKVLCKDRNKLLSFWKILNAKGLIGDKKYARLIRNTPFSDEELGNFIARQLVETRQATKETATMLKRLCPDSRIVYVKAKNVSDFRRRIDFMKCRSINDLHHAHDAYLNIVVGNVFDTKFTSNPINFIKNDYKNKTYNLEKIYDYDVKRKDKIAWLAENKETDQKGSESLVLRNLSKYDVRVTQRTFIKNDELFDQNLKRKGVGDFPIKENNKRSDTNKYGGYKGTKIAYFVLVEDKNKKKTIEGIPSFIYNKVKNGEKDSPLIYLDQTLGIKDPKILRDKIKIGSLLKVNKFLYTLSGKSGNKILIKGAVQLIVDKDINDYIKKIEKYNYNLSTNKDYKLTRYNGFDKEDNLRLYDFFIDKFQNSIYKFRSNVKIKEIIEGRCKFENLTLENQIKLLTEILLLFTRDNNAVDLSLIDLPKNTGKTYINKKVDNVGIKIINQSITGLYENSEDLLRI